MIDISDGSVVIDVILDDGTVGKGVAKMDKQFGGLASAGQKAALGIGKIVTALGLVAAASKAIDMVKGSISTAFNRIDTFERFERVMNTVTGSVEETQKALSRTNDIVKGTAYTLDGAASAVQNFVTRGLSVDKATKYVEAFGDAVAFYGDGSQAQFDNVTDALAKMTTKGKVEMDQLNRLFDAGIDAVGMYAKATGRDAASVQKDLSAGKISAEDFIDTVSTAMMEGTNGVVKIAGTAKDAGASWGSTFTNMNAAVARGVQNIIKKIDEMLTQNGLPDMRTMIANFGEYFESTLNKIADVIPIVSEKIGSIKSAIEPWVPVVQNVVDTVKSLIMDRISTAIDFAKQIFASLKDFWQQNGQQILTNAITIFTGIWNTVKTYFDAVYGVIFDVLGSKVMPFIQSTLANLQQFWQENGAQIMEAVQNAFSFIQKVIEFVMPAIKFVIEYVWAAIEDIIGGTLSVIQGLIQVFTGIFTGDWSQLWEGIKKILGGAVDLILGIMSLSFLGGIRKVLLDLGKNAVKIVKGMWDDIAKFFKTFTDDAASKVMTMSSNVWTFVKNMATNFKNTIISLKDDVVKKFQEIKDNIIEKVKSIDLFQIGKDIIHGLINGIGSMASAVWDKAKSIATGIGDSIKKVLGIASPSKLMIQFGEWTGEGLEIGIGSTIKDIKKTSDELGKAVSTGELLKSIKADAVNLTRGIVPKTGAYYSSSSTTANNINNSKTFSVVNNNGLGSSEIARATERALQKLAFQWGP